MLPHFCSVEVICEQALLVTALDESPPLIPTCPGGLGAASLLLGRVGIQAPLIMLWGVGMGMKVSGFYSDIT